MGAKIRRVDLAVQFHCPGCQEDHMIYVERCEDYPNHPVWGFNGSDSAPTFTPSILVTQPRWVPPVTNENLADWRRAPWAQTRVDDTCHSFVTDGRIQFLSDCTHALAGQTVELPDWTS